MAKANVYDMVTNRIIAELEKERTNPVGKAVDGCTIRSL